MGIGTVETVQGLGYDTGARRDHGEFLAQRLNPRLQQHGLRGQ
ncbi:hypothetical protein [Streptomyces flaveolus]